MSVRSQTGNRKHQQRLLDSTNCKPTHSLVQLWQTSCQVAQMYWREGPRCQMPATPIESDCRRTTDQPHRPLEGSVGQGDRILPAQEHVLHERLQAFLL